MIFIVHGEDIAKSRQHFQLIVDKLSSNSILKLDNKDISPEKFINYLDTPSMFSDEKNIVINNFFSLHPATQKKLSILINDSKNTNFYLWQDKTLTTTNLSLFPSAKVFSYPLPKLLFFCLNTIKPGNFQKFQEVYLQLLKQEPFELFLYLLKGHIRRLLIKNYQFDQNKLLISYKNLINLEFQIKSGQIEFPKEFALELIVKDLIL